MTHVHMHGRLAYVPGITFVLLLVRRHSRATREYDADNTIYASTKNSALKAPEEMDVSPVEHEGMCFLAANGVQCVIEPINCGACFM